MRTVECLKALDFGSHQVNLQGRSYCFSLLNSCSGAWDQCRDHTLVAHREVRQELLPGDRFLVDDISVYRFIISNRFGGTDGKSTCHTPV